MARNVGRAGLYLHMYTHYGFTIGCAPDMSSSLKSNLLELRIYLCKPIHAYTVYIREGDSPFCATLWHFLCQGDPEH